VDRRPTGGHLYMQANGRENSIIHYVRSAMEHSRRHDATQPMDQALDRLITDPTPRGW
jgi:hypothetical protein